MLHLLIRLILAAGMQFHKSVPDLCLRRVLAPVALA